MEIVHQQEGKRGEFFIQNEGEIIGEFTYSMMDDTTMIANHTGVKPAMRGKGLALQLVEHAAKYARANKLKIIPSCSYVRWVFEHHPEMADVVKMY